MYGLADIPLFVRGGILPLKTMADVASDFADPLVWALWPGAAAGGYTLYEDDGNSEAYSGGEYVTQQANFTWGSGAGGLTFTLAPAAAGEALPSGYPQVRGQVLQVRGLRAPPSAVTLNGVSVAQGSGVPGWRMAVEHTLAETQGALVVTAGPQSSWATTVIAVTL